jgi:hypothetical protein
VHDGAQGFGFWTRAVDAELYGNIIYNVGTPAAFDGDRAHGHSIYVQNETGVKRIVDNILFNGLSFGIHAYTEGGHLDNLYIEGNTAFNHGVPVDDAKANILIGGNSVALNPTLLNNFSYYSGDQGRAVDINYREGCDRPTVNNNYLVGGTALGLGCTNVLSVTGNTFYGGIDGFTQALYPYNTYLPTRPITGLQVFVRPNQYEAGRANITIFNWSRSSAVSINLSTAGLTSGQSYEIRNAQNYLGAPVYSGIYNASSPTISLSMTSPQATAVASPVGMATPASTLPEFGVFVVVPR